jgi:hypothetical protein
MHRIRAARDTKRSQAGETAVRTAKRALSPVAAVCGRHEEFRA